MVRLTSEGLYLLSHLRRGRKKQKQATLFKPVPNREGGFVAPHFGLGA